MKLVKTLTSCVVVMEYKKLSAPKGFTIVELLIVVVVIAILAAITIVAYNGIREKAQISSVQSQLSQAMKKVQMAAVINNEVYPATLAGAGIEDSGGVTYQYTSDNTAASKSFCITATLNQTRSYYVASNTGGTQQEGICPGHNLIVWYEDNAGAPTPITLGTGVNVDTSVKRAGVSSMRISTSTFGVTWRGSPRTVASGQVIVASLWIKTDSDWNGLSNNSKIRFGDANTNNAYIASCGYNGVKTTWTFVTCSYTSNGSYSTITTTVSNDGTVGQIWIDDLSISIANP